MNFVSTFLLLANLPFLTIAQQAGNQSTENAPKLSWQKCTRGGCKTVRGELTADESARWLHNVNGTTSCKGVTGWNSTFCPDPVTCAKNCALEGIANYSANGVTTNGSALSMRLKNPNGYGPPRLYLKPTGKNKYEHFHLLNKEFTFDVDMSRLPCGTNGALYFAEMDEDGGMAKYPGNKAGARYGTGYCDAQCPSGPSFIQGEATVPEGNATVTKYGACCNEMDIWEGNKISTGFTPHPCNKPNVYRCEGKDDCGGICDKGGCDNNPYRNGNPNFYGPGTNKTLDTNQKMTVVTQFFTGKNKPFGELVEIRRLYIQKGKIFKHASTKVANMTGFASTSDRYCSAKNNAFSEGKDQFASYGGLKTMGESLARGVVLIFSLWTDSSETAMQWLDGSRYPATAALGTPGSARGTCNGNSSSPAYIAANSPDAAIVFSNVKFGEIGSTFKLGGKSCRRRKVRV
ncbi:glycoside hydrolase family protein [Venturia nashicola]|nr:glycoside hydrolase family protein [Venturia nashicola]